MRRLLPEQSPVGRLDGAFSRDSGRVRNSIWPAGIRSNSIFTNSCSRASSLVLLATAVNGCAQGAEGSDGAEGCDRDCVSGVTQQYVDALLSNDFSSAPVADTITMVENSVPIGIGEGLWETASKSEHEFEIHVPDVHLQQAGWLGLVEREGTPVILAIRLTLEGGLVSEAEHLLAEPVDGKTDLFAQIRPGLMSRIKPDEQIAHEELIRIGASYYDALDNNNGALAPFADDCQRQENGRITAGIGAVGSPNTDFNNPSVALNCKSQIDSQAFVYIDRIENREMIAADPVTGLAMGFSQFRHPMNNLPYNVTLSDGTTSERNLGNMPYEPFDMVAAHIFKIGSDRQIHEIEAVGLRAPFGSSSGRE